MHFSRQPVAWWRASPAAAHSVRCASRRARTPDHPQRPVASQIAAAQVTHTLGKLAREAPSDTVTSGARDVSSNPAVAVFPPALRCKAEC